jgi:hypothetical protein
MKIAEKKKLQPEEMEILEEVPLELLRGIEPRTFRLQGGCSAN